MDTLSIFTLLSILIALPQSSMSIITRKSKILIKLLNFDFLIYTIEMLDHTHKKFFPQTPFCQVPKFLYVPQLPLHGKSPRALHLKFYLYQFSHVMIKIAFNNVLHCLKLKFENIRLENP